MISGNTLTAATLSPGSAGIWINGDIGPGVVFAAPEVNNNTVTGFNIGIGMDTLPEASMSCNTLENNSDSGLFFSSDGTFAAMNNNLVNNGLGLKVDTGSTTTVMAEHNWWGDWQGPVACGSCNKIDVGGGSVDYSPWLTGLSVSQCGAAVFPWHLFMPAFLGGLQR